MGVYFCVTGMEISFYNCIHYSVYCVAKTEIFKHYQEYTLELILVLLIILFTAGSF